MTVVVDLESLIIEEDKAAIYTTALDVCTAIGLPVTSWQAGDPTRALLHVESETLESLESTVANFIRAGFLDYATGAWLAILAEQVFGVTIVSATYAGTDVVLTNASGGVYTIAANDLTIKNTTTGKTYHNTTGGTLSASSTLTVTVVADEAGSDSSAAATEIDALVTTLLGVTCSNALAAVGVDDEDPATLRQRCRDRLGRLTTNGPKDAYTDVALDPDLTLTTAVTRARAYGDSSTGAVSVYLAGPSGAVAAADVTLVETAILAYATPLCITPTVASCTAVTVAITYSMKLYKRSNVTVAEAEEAIEAALEAMLAAQPIGGDIVSPATTGNLYRSRIAATIAAVYPNDAFDVAVSTPSGDTALTNAQVASLGTITPTITLVVNPT